MKKFYLFISILLFILITLNFSKNKTNKEETTSVIENYQIVGLNNLDNEVFEELSIYKDWKLSFKENFLVFDNNKNNILNQNLNFSTKLSLTKNMNYSKNEIFFDYENFVLYYNKFDSLKLIENKYKFLYDEINNDNIIYNVNTTRSKSFSEIFTIKNDVNKCMHDDYFDVNE